MSYCERTDCTNNDNKHCNLADNLHAFLALNPGGPIEKMNYRQKYIEDKLKTPGECLDTETLFTLTGYQTLYKK